jgi:hypothetical protein
MWKRRLGSGQENGSSRSSMTGDEQHKRRAEDESVCYFQMVALTGYFVCGHCVEDNVVNLSCHGNFNSHVILAAVKQTKLGLLP